MLNVIVFYSPAKPFSHPARAVLALALVPLAPLGCASQGPVAGHPHVEQVIIQSPPGTPRPPYRFSPADERLLDDVQRGAFNYLWAAGDRPGWPGFAPDRTSKTVVSIAGVGFQLSAICVGVERAWITREQGRQRALAILSALHDHPDNRKAGLFFHFLDPATGGQPEHAPERVVSTIDSALFFAGAATASSYFGGEVASLADRLFEQADWRFFIAPAGPGDQRVNKGFLSLGWKPADPALPTAEGALLPYAWVDNGCEHRLVTMLAACAPRESHRLQPAVYYRLRRQLGEYADSGPIVWFPWSGALFTAFFSHCWVDYAGLGPDEPAALGVPRRSRVDWWENSRRLTLMHRRKAIENPKGLPTLGERAWGLSASDVQGGYAVPGLFPNPIPMPGASPDDDFPLWRTHDNYGDGTIAPYAAGSCILFEPRLALDALRHYRSLTRPDGTPLLWNDPAAGGYGFQDAFNLGTGWVADDCLAIDQGPLLLAIENARSGLIWNLFHQHRWVKEGLARLRLNPTPREPAPLP